MWFVYIIRCGDGSLYTGSTNNLQKRFLAHKNGKGAKYTRSRGVKRIVFSEKYVKKIMALKRERGIKKLRREEKLKLIKKVNLVK